MTDRPHDDLDALRARAERGTPVGPDAVLAAARRAAADEPGEGALAPASAGRSRRWLATAAAAAIVLAAGVGAVLVSRDDGSANGSGTDPFCAVLARPAYAPRSVDADLLVYLEPAADPSTIDAVRAKLDADPLVVAARYVGPTESLERFRELFAGEQTLIDDVEADDLPTSFEVTYAPGTRVAAEAWRWSRDPQVFEVRDLAAMQARVLDFIAWVGDRPPPPSGGSAELGFQPSPSAWEEHAGDVRAVADPEVATAIDELTDVVEHRGGAVDGSDRSYDRAEAATAVIVTAAERRCDLTPVAYFASADGADSSTATTSPADPATTTTAVPVFGN